MKTVLILHPDDNVGNCLEDLEPGDKIEGVQGEKKSVFTGVDSVSFAFKVAVRDIPKGQGVIKYGEKIGEASQDIRVGECVHIHNIIGKRA